MTEPTSSEPKEPAPAIDPGQSLAQRFRWAAFALTMAVVLIVGTASLIYSVWENARRERADHANTLRIIGEHISYDIDARFSELEQLGHSSMVWTALTDSEDREMYLKPFLAGRIPAVGERSLALLDYRGRLVAGTLAIAPSPAFGAMLERVIHSKEPTTVLLPKEHMLLVVYPVLFPYTREAIGTFVGIYDINAIFHADLAGRGASYGIALYHDDTLLAREPAEPAEGFFPERFALPLPHGNEDLHLELYAVTYEWVYPSLGAFTLRLAIGLALAFLAWQLAGRIATRLTRRLDRLATACAEVAAGERADVDEEKSADELGLLSRTLSRALRAQFEIQSHLEELVAVRTRDLEESEQRYRQVFEANTAVKLIIDPADGRIADANPAACEFYGYPREKLLTLALADISVGEAELLPNDAHLAESPVSHFHFTHRLASGEIRDVEVYSAEITVRGKPYLHSIVHDVTERRRAEAALRASEVRFRAYIESSPIAVVVLDAEGRFEDANPAASELLDCYVDELRGRGLADFVPPNEHARIEEVLDTVRTEAHFEGERRLVSATGHQLWVAVTAARLYGGRFLAFVRDISAQREADAALRLTASVFAHTHEAIIITDTENRIVDANDAFTQISGYTRGEVLGKTPTLLRSGRQSPEFYEALWAQLRAQDYWRGEVWNRRKDGTDYPALLTISVIRDAQGQVSQYVAVFADITLLKTHEQQLETIAHHDALTGLPNRVLLADRMHMALKQAHRSRLIAAVCYLDLDGFKQVNDRYGHAAGDQLLIEIARRLEAAVRGEDTVARLGGDEFVLVLAQLPGTEQCHEVVQRVIRTVHDPVELAGGTVVVSASVGVALYPENAQEPDALLRCADQAMYAAKHSGKNRYRMCSGT